MKRKDWRQSRLKNAKTKTKDKKGGWLEGLFKDHNDRIDTHRDVTEEQVAPSPTSDIQIPTININLPDSDMSAPTPSGRNTMNPYRRPDRIEEPYSFAEAYGLYVGINYYNQDGEIIGRIVEIRSDDSILISRSDRDADLWIPSSSIQNQVRARENNQRLPLVPPGDF